MEVNNVSTEKPVEKKSKFSKSSFKKFFTKKKIIILVAIVLCVALICFFLFGHGKDSDVEAQSYVEATAEIGNITASVEQSGVIEPLDRYEITSLVRGEIILAPFEEGDFVNEGDILYQIDDEDAQLTMEKTQMSLDEANDNVSKLNIYAPSSGKLTNFSLEVGDSVGNGLIGNIVNTDVLSVDVPFSINDFNKISIGDSVTVTSALYMTSLPGKVSHKYYADVEAASDGGILRNVEIEVENPGAIAENTTVAATVHTSSGDVSSSGSGTIGSGTVNEIRADVTGTVSYVGFKNGDHVSKGALIATLTNQTLLNTQKNSQINLRSNRKSLDDYKITSPISGTVITKNSKTGDKIDSSNSQTVMMVVADMSKMKFTISVDELDISDIQLGQTAVVDADALPDEIFEAKVTNISSEGVSSGDGVTTYDIELTIDEPGNLRPGMNVNATIILSQANNVVIIPEDALMSVRGTTATVLVKTDGKTSNNSESKTEKTGAPTNKGDGEAPARPDGGEHTGMPAERGETPSNNENKDGTNNNGRGGSARGASNIPDGCEVRRVEIGISDGTYIEIVSGISEGETVVYIPSSTGSSNPFAAMMGGMMGGGMPGGNRGGNSGMSGGNRAGGGMSGGNRAGGGMSGGGR